jgi:hypothetical protein
VKRADIAYRIPDVSGTCGRPDFLAYRRHSASPGLEQIWMLLNHGRLAEVARRHAALSQ